MKIKIIAQDPSMSNWGLVAATFNTDTGKVEINEMMTIHKNKLEKSVKKALRVSNIDLNVARDLSKGINSFFDKYKPAFTIVEIPHGSQSSASMKGYGICLGLLGAVNTQMIQMTEMECKVNALGKRTATKKEMIAYAMAKHPEAKWHRRMFKGELVGVDGKNEHIADAIAALYAGLESDQFKAAIVMAKQLMGE